MGNKGNVSRNTGKPGNQSQRGGNVPTQPTVPRMPAPSSTPQPSKK